MENIEVWNVGGKFCCGDQYEYDKVATTYIFASLGMTAKIGVKKTVKYPLTPPPSQVQKWEWKCMKRMMGEPPRNNT